MQQEDHHCPGIRRETSHHATGETIRRALGYFKRNLVSQKLLDFLKVLKSSGFNMYFFHVISQSGIQLVALKTKWMWTPLALILNLNFITIRHI